MKTVTVYFAMSHTPNSDVESYTQLCDRDAFQTQTECALLPFCPCKVHPCIHSVCSAEAAHPLALRQAPRCCTFVCACAYVLAISHARENLVQFEVV